MNKELKDLCNDLTSWGWTISEGKKQIKATHPKGGSVFFARTPSDRRAMLNIKSEIRKLERQK